MDVRPWLSSGAPVDNCGDASSGSNEWREPGSSAGSSGAPSESEEETFIEHPHSVDSDSDPSMSDNLSEKEILVPL